jgi:general secretion pathway protein C
MTWMLVPVPQGSAPPAPTLNLSTEHPQVDVLSMSRDIVAKHLFGQAQTVGTGQGVAAIPETQLKLVLRGVMASKDARTATAIIADPSGNEDFYTVGKQLPGGATLKEVHAQYIVLSRGGRFETLRLPEDTLNVTGSGAASSAATNATPISVSPEAGELLQQYRAQFLKDPESLANVLQGEPYWENGRMVGYRLRPGRDATALSKFGIQSGDVVTAINGVNLADPAGRMELLRNMANTTQFNVDIIRGGRPLSISIPLGQQG